ncbi:MAG: hypothetical protein K5756_00060 [Clostridiales bacterium]|nr:hypothetical protein [Clostridiales bacterium]
MDFKTALTGIAANMEEALSEVSLKPVMPEGAKGSPVVEAGGKTYVTFTGDGGTVRLEASGDRIALLSSDIKADEIKDGDLGQISLMLFDPEIADERDIKSTAAEFSETLIEKYGKTKSFVAPQKKARQTVSKTAVKNGEAFYDANSFAVRLIGAFPELKALYNKNCDENNEFLPEEFFAQGGTKVILDTIRINDPQKMKRLFNILNDVYENGVNNVQSLIVVSIFGEINNDQQMLANCVDYMSNDLCAVVIRVNKYLASPAGKTARMRLENPPKYKPKKEKKGGLMSKMLGLEQGPGSDINSYR